MDATASAAAFHCFGFARNNACIKGLNAIPASEEAAFRGARRVQIDCATREEGPVAVSAKLASLRAW